MSKRKKTELVRVTPRPLEFDYGSLKPAQVKILQKTARDILEKVRKSIRGFIEAGQGFMRAHDMLEHGQFLAWLAAEGWHYRTARRLMDLAEQFGPIIDIVSHLGIAVTALYHLAAASTPYEARQIAIDRAKAGETITAAIVDEIILSVKKMRPRKGPSLPAETLLERLAKNMEWIWDHHDPRDEGEIARHLRQYLTLWEEGIANCNRNEPPPSPIRKGPENRTATIGTVQVSKGK